MSEQFDVVIVGGGPAALAAGLYAGRAKLKTLILERNLLGGQVATTSMIENYPGFARIAGSELAASLAESALRFGAIPRLDEVMKVTVSGERRFSVTTITEQICATAVIVATGGSHRKLGVSGEAALLGRGVSHCAVCDGPDCEGAEVVVVGGGDSALQEALLLAEYASSVTIVHRRQGLRAGATLQERVRQNPKIRLILGWVVDEMQGRNSVERVLLREVSTGLREALPAQGVFVYVGIQPNTECLAELALPLSNGFLVTDERMRTTVPGLFAAGDVRAKAVRQIATAVGEGAEAALAAVEYVRGHRT